MRQRNSERAALVDEISRAPGADAPRLRAAAWFEKQGDDASVARAEFIRAQLAMSNTRIHNEARATLGASALRLLKRWAKTWAGAHPLLAKVIYRRGFAEYAHVHVRKFLPHRRELFALEPVRDVRITGYYRPREDLSRAIARCSEWSQVETLRFHHQGPHHEPRAALLELLESPHLTKLRALHCTRFQFDANDRRRFENLPLLKRVEALTMPTLDWFPSDPGPFFSEGWDAPARWTNLRSLALMDARAEIMRQWTELPWWRALRELELWGANDALEIVANAGLPALTSLTLSAGYYRVDDEDTDEGASVLDAARASPLTRLDLTRADAAVQALPRLLAVSRWTLESLRVARTNGELAEQIAGSNATRHLRELDASRLDNDALATLASAKGPSLQALSFVSNGRGREEGAEPELVARLLRSPLCASLNELAISVRSLDRSIAGAIAALPHLAHLSIDAASIDAEAAQTVETHLRDGWYEPPERDESPESEEEERAYVQRWIAKRRPERIAPLDRYVPRL